MREPFRHRLRVRWGECDMQGVVFYPKYAEYVDIALTELWRARVRPYGEMIERGVDLMVGEVQLRFRASARFDDEIDVVLDVDRLGETSLHTLWRIERDGELLTEGTIRHVCVSAETYTKMRIPDDLREALA